MGEVNDSVSSSVLNIDIVFWLVTKKNESVYSNPLLLTVRVPLVIQLGNVDLYVHSVFSEFCFLVGFLFFKWSGVKKGDECVEIVRRGAKAVSWLIYSHTQSP